MVPGVSVAGAVRFAVICALILGAMLWTLDFLIIKFFKERSRAPSYGRRSEGWKERKKKSYGTK